MPLLKNPFRSKSKSVNPPPMVVSPTPQLCPNCNKRVVASDPNTGKSFDYCSKTCATQARYPGQARQKGVPAQSLCEQCGRRPKFTSGNKVHPYCGRTCAELAANPRPTPTNGSGNCKERGCISCRAAPKNGKSVMCKPCHDDASSRAPAIIEVPQDHENFKSVEKQFKDSWRHSTTCPEVKAVYKIVSSDTSLKQYQQYLDGVEAKGNFTAMGKARGNENRRWHGTKRTCELGDPGNTTFCTDTSCALCCIIRTSFDLKFFKGATGWGRFGAGIYTSSTSSKSNDYSKNVGINSDWKALLLNRVVVGYGKKLTQDDTSLTEPPPGFDSVLAEVVPGGALNYDELVVYTNDAVRPSYLVMYQKP